MEDKEGKYHGCWAITEPEHGSDTCLAPHSRKPEEFGKGQVTATLDGDEWVINGAKSSWVSSAPAATHALLHVFFPPDANLGRGGMCIVPLDIDGVTKGSPIDKLGYRDCPQGELVFDNVRIPEEYMLLSAGDLYPTTMGALVSTTSCGMNALWTGVLRAIFEEAMRYAKTRVQGGKPLIEHSSIKLQIYKIFEKLQVSKVYGRKLTEHVWGKVLKGEFDVPVQQSYVAQIIAKRYAFEAAHEALQIHGGYGLTKEFLIEKLFRDARHGIIMDYTTDVLGLAVVEELIKQGKGGYTNP
jgi:alkylation response protein AidB-like acyl-CoA dehydrogenase